MFNAQRSTLNAKRPTRSAGGFGFGFDRNDARAVRSAKTKEVNGIGPRMYATRARAQIITRLKRDGLDSSRERRGANEQIGIRGPYRPLDDRFVTRVTNEIAQQRYAIQAKRAERIGDARDRHEWTKDPWCHTPHPSNGFGWVRAVHGSWSLGDHEIGTTFEPFDQLGQMFRLVGEVGLHDDHPVAARIARAT
jgi:hypothetical protein